MAITGTARRFDIWLVAGAIGLSAAGDFIALIGLGLNGNEMHGDGIGVAAVFIALWAPIAVLAGYVGLVVDRFETTRLLLVASLFQALVGVALAFASPFGLMKAELLVIANQQRRGEYVPGPCTHRPSHHESRQYPKPVG